MLVVWSYLGFIAVLAGSQKFVIVQEGNPERDSDMASYIRGAVLHFIVPPVIDIAFMAVSFSGRGKAWTTARAWRLVLAGYGVGFFLFGIIGLLATRSSVTAAYSALTSSIRYLESQLTVIYAVSVLGFALWTGAGLLFLFLPPISSSHGRNSVEPKRARTIRHSLPSARRRPESTAVVKGAKAV